MLAGQSGCSSGRAADAGCYSCQDINLFSLCAFQQGTPRLNEWIGGDEWGDTTTQVPYAMNSIPWITGGLWTLVIRDIFFYLYVIHCNLGLVNRLESFGVNIKGGDEQPFHCWHVHIADTFMGQRHLSKAASGRSTHHRLACESEDMRKGRTIPCKKAN